MKITHGIEYLLVRLLAFLFRLFPHDTAIKLGDRLGRAAGNLFSGRHKVVIENLNIAFGESLSAARREEMARDVFGNIGKTMAEVCRFPKISREQLLEIISSDGTDKIKEVFDHGKGSIILGSHFGNWELAGAYVNALGYPIDFMVRGQHNRLVDDYLTSLRSRWGVKVIHSERGMKDVLRALKNNHPLAMVADQHAGSQGIFIKFFGRLVSVPRAPATLAVRMGSPILIGHTFRNPDNTHFCHFEEPLYPDPDADAAEEIFRLTKAFTERIEAAIRRRPELWLWTHRRFKPVAGTEQSEGAYVE